MTQFFMQFHCTVSNNDFLSNTSFFYIFLFIIFIFKIKMTQTNGNI